MLRNSYLEFNEQNLRENYENLKKDLASEEIFPTLSNNHYGCDYKSVFYSLKDAPGFVVDDKHIISFLRGKNYKNEIIIRVPNLTLEILKYCQRFNVSIIIENIAQLSSLEKYCKYFSLKIPKLYLKYKDNFEKTGLNEEILLNYLSIFRSMKNVKKVICLLEMFDSYKTPLQNTINLQRYQLAKIKFDQFDLEFCLINSFALVKENPNYFKINFKNLYGLVFTTNYLKFKSVLSFRSKISKIKIQSKDGKEILKLGLVNCGYSDGYFKNIKSGTPILVNGLRTKILGRVRSDCFLVDLLDIKGINIGDEITLWGESKFGSILTLNEIEQYSDSNIPEVLNNALKKQNKLFYNTTCLKIA